MTIFPITGTLSGKSGSFVIEDNGTFEAGMAKSSFRIAKGSGTSQLAGISGRGSYQADKNGCVIEVE